MKKNDAAQILKEHVKDIRIIIGAVLLAVVTVMFAASVNMRSEYKDYVSLDHHHHLTATSVVFTNFWLDDGIVHDHFAMMANPDSVEFSDLKDRSFYDSYPSGCIVPLYLLAKLSGKDEITFGFVQRWDLFNQYAVTLLLAFLVYLLFLRIKTNPYVAFIAAIIPAVVNLFMPGPFYFFHSVYFADQAVILPFVLAVFLEFLRTSYENPKMRKVVDILEAVVIFAGTITDYLFLCVLVVVYAKRLILGEISLKSFGGWLKDSLKFAAPAIIAAALFVLQLAVNGPVRIINMFLFRTGVNDTSGWTAAFSRVFWKDYIVSAYGSNADIIIKFSLAVVVLMTIAYFIIKKRKKIENKSIALLLATALMIILPCFMQVYLLKNHSAIHDFSTLKFSVVMSVVPYVVIPAAVIEFVRLLKGGKLPYTLVHGVAAVVFAASVCVFTGVTHAKNAESYFPEISNEVVTVGNFIRENTGYNDVIFSDNYEIFDANDYPAKLAFAKKRIYKTEKISDIYTKVNDIEEDYTVNVFSFGSGQHSSDIQKLIDSADTVVNGEGMTLYKISKDKFKEIAK